MRLQTDTKALILAVLEIGERHGYGISRAVKDESGGRIKLSEGQLYPALHAMEESGWVTARWDSGGTDQPKRVYAITEEGRKELAARSKRWMEFVEGVAGLLGSKKSSEVEL